MSGVVVAHVFEVALPPLLDLFGVGLSQGQQNEQKDHPCTEDREHSEELSFKQFTAFRLIHDMRTAQISF